MMVTAMARTLFRAEWRYFMNRIICDICGSEYPETSDRCPICSYARQGNEKVVAAAGETVRTKVKGGQFSTKNVKKRHKAQQHMEEPDGEQKGSNRPLIIVIIVLLIAILLVSVYIGVRFFRGRSAYQNPPRTTAAAPAPTETTVPPEIPCTGIVLESAVVDLEDPGVQKQLSVQLMPADTTDTVSYTSADPSVAEVSETGLITAVGSGQTSITITCGGISKPCTVVCWFQEEPTLPPETTVPPTEAPKPTEPKQTEPKPTEAPKLKLDQEDVSCFTENEVFTLSVKLGSKSIGRPKDTWTSSDPSVATVENGTVTAVGRGTATITAEYEGKKASCTVRCRFDDTNWKASASDVTITVGESFRLTVTNDSGDRAKAVWTMSIDGVVSMDGSTITGRAPGEVTLTTTVDGVTMTCIVRVR